MWKMGSQKDVFCYENRITVKGYLCTEITLDEREKGQKQGPLDELLGTVCAEVNFFSLHFCSWTVLHL